MSISKKDKILDLFFNEHWKQVDIAKELNVSKQHVSKIVTADSRYENTKQEKLQRNAIKRKEYLKDYFKTYKRSRCFNFKHDKFIKRIKITI